jgi:hypothetical protein
LSQTYVYKLAIPVKYTDLPKQILKENLPKDTLKVKISASGYQIIKLYINRPSFEISVNDYQLTKNKIWKPDNFRNLINEKIGVENMLISIEPAQLSFDLNNIFKKYVKIRNKVTINYKQGYKNVNNVKIIPDSIWVFGKQKLIDSLQYIATEAENIDQVNSDIYRQITLDFPDGVKSNEQKVFLKAKVAQFIEAETKLELALVNVPDSIELVLFPKQLTLKYKVFRSDYKLAQKMKVKAVLDFKKKDSVLYPKLLDVPSYIFDPGIFPDKIAFLIKNK